MNYNKLYLTFLTIVFVLMPIIISAQITYTDINPDVTTTLNENQTITSLVSIDFNGDNTEEYNFRWDYFGGQWFLHMTYSGNNEMAGATSPAGGYDITPLTGGTAIDSNLTYDNDIPEPFIGDFSNTNFMGLEDRYVGCKFVLGGNTHYGWVRVNLDNDLNFTVKDYAYEETPNTVIIAGEGGDTASVNDLNFDQYFNYYYNLVSDKLFLKIKKNILVESIMVYNLLGQKATSNYQLLNSKIEMDMQGLDSGVYFIKIQTENRQVLTKKIIIR